MNIKKIIEIIGEGRDYAPSPSPRPRLARVARGNAGEVCLFIGRKWRVVGRVVRVPDTATWSASLTAEGLRLSRVEKPVRAFKDIEDALSYIESAF